MKHSIFYLFLITSILSIKGQNIDKPNVIIFYVDDLGWQDTNLDNLGNPVPWLTPNMDKLATLGAKFSNAYSPAPTCAPSRAAMLSGRHPVKTGMTQVSGGFIPALKKAKAFNKLIGPYFPHRLQDEEFTIAEALKANGYISKHVGKWHIAGNADFPRAIHQGFDSEFTDRGVQQGMNDRYTKTEFGGFGGANDDYPLDADGVPFDSVTDAGVGFLAERVAAGSTGNPFFLYMATWLVHTPIQTRDFELLKAISSRLGLTDLTFEGIPDIKTPLTADGEYNPFYGAMVETVDWSLGKVLTYLETTVDPNSATGELLIDTTYVIFSSDNGASEQNNVDSDDGTGTVTKQEEVVADNFPLDLGKTSSKEGGIRVPLIISGPGITQNVTYDNIVNGLDFFPTVLTLTGTSVDQAISDDFDGADLTPLLKGTSTTVIKDGSERTDLFWHYPNADDDKSKSAIRRGDYKLYKLYETGGYEAFQLYNGVTPVDLNEQIDVLGTMDTTIKDSMIATLEAFLNNNGARFPTWNPDYAESDAPLPNQLLIPTITSTNYDQNGQVVEATMSSNSGDGVIAVATLLYQEAISLDEWHESSVPVTIAGNIITANVPVTATAVAFNMIDSNNFLVVSDEITTVPGEVVTTVPGEIAVLDALGEQTFNVGGTNYAELLGDADVRGTSPAEYIQTRAVGGGAKFSVKAATGLHSVVCDKVSFEIQALKDDVIGYDVIIGGVTQSDTYTSGANGDRHVFEFTGPVTFTSVLQDVEIVTTSMSSAGTPRLRIHNLTFNVTETVLLADAPNEISLNDTDLTQMFDAGRSFSELLPNTTVNSGGDFLQNIVVGGGAKYLVKTADNVTSAVCTGVEFRVRAADTFTVDYDINFGGQTKSYDYTSSKTNTDVFSEFIFPTPITLTNQPQELEIISTSITDVATKFRIYDVTFTIEQAVLGSEDIEIDQTEGVKMFPNPVKDKFSLTEEVDSGIIYNIYGGKVYEFSNKYQNINISNLLSGLYILQIIKDGSRKQYKLVKE